MNVKLINKIKDLRLSIEEFSLVSGISAYVIGRWISGRQSPEQTDKEFVANLLGCEIDEIF